MGKFCRCLLSPAVALGDLGTLGLMNNGAALPLWASFSLFNNSCIPVVEALHKTSAFSESEAKLGESDACMPEVLIRNIHTREHTQPTCPVLLSRKMPHYLPRRREGRARPPGGGGEASCPGGCRVGKVHGRCAPPRVGDCDARHPSKSGLFRGPTLADGI